MYIVKTKACLEYRLRREMKRGRLLDVSSVRRQLGKTTLLVKIARENNAVVLCPSLQWAGYARRNFPGVSFLSVGQLTNYSNYNISRVVLEEGIPEEVERVIRKKFRVIGGYSKIGGDFYYENK